MSNHELTPAPDAPRDDQPRPARRASRRSFLRGTLAASTTAAGLGSGITGSALAAHPVEQVDVDLRVSERTPSTLGLAWNDPEGSDPPYRVTLSWRDVTWTVQTDVSSLRVGRPPVAPGRTYEVRVSEIEAPAFSVGRGSLEVQTPATGDDAPSTPREPVVTERTKSSLSLVWTPPPEYDVLADSYEIAYAPVARGDQPTPVSDGERDDAVAETSPVPDWTVQAPFERITTTETTATVSDLRDGYHYLIQVWAVDADGNASATVSTVSHTAGDMTAPSSPSGLGQTDRSASSVTVAWDPATDEGGSGLDHYEVVWDHGELSHEDGEVIGSKTVPADTTATTIDGLEPHERYQVTVSAVDAGGNESFPAHTYVATGGTEPAITDTGFEPLGTSTDSPENDTEIAVHPDDGTRVHATGSIVLGNPCLEPAILKTSFDGDRLRVVLTDASTLESAQSRDGADDGTNATDDGTTAISNATDAGSAIEAGSACAEVLAEAGYELQFGLTHAPSEVVIEHRASGDDFERTWTAGESERRYPVGIEVDGDVGVDERTAATVELDGGVDEGIASFELEVSTADDDIALVANVGPAEGFELAEQPVPLDADASSTIAAVDDPVIDGLPSGANGLATVELLGHASGTTLVDVAVTELETSAGETVPTMGIPASLEVTGLPPVGGTVPGDLDDDGLHEDFNANGERDFDDLVRFFEHMDDPAVSNNTDAYDFNGNDDVDFADVVELFRSL